ncbi:hypothetical protein D1610_11630 [Sphingomonas gilva]|uniref:Mu-like prophage I protein n=1 Tax=Sphingomonas gilva TaxID=2305907 RepID=A0A396RS95_9SPHN|nr:phage protease [Sphingomonas gilva]RHW17193.1 hypothetical protein D1610_11630 [Sphingomonas gilva]
MKRGLQTAAGHAIGSAIEIAGAEPPARIQLMPIGRWKGKNGAGPYELSDRAHADAVIAATAARLGKSDFMVDYDHQAPNGAVPGVGGTAIASAWVKADDLVAADDGIWAENVQWTAKASQHIRDREYRYISPYFLHRPDGRVTLLINAGLTNTPNFDLAAVAASTTGEDLTMTIPALILAALGLGEDATVEAAVASITGLKEARTNLAATASALGLAADATGAQVQEAAASALAGKGNASELASVKAELDEIKGERITAAVATAIQAGKITPAQKDWAESYAKEKGLAAFASFLGGQATVLAPGARGKPDVDLSSDALTPDEKAVASALGLSEEAYLKTRKETAQ